MIKLHITSAKRLSQLVLSGLVLSTALTGCGAIEKWSDNWPLGGDDNYQYPQEADNIPVESWSTPPNTQIKPVIANMAPAQGLKPQSIAANMNGPLGAEEIRARFLSMEQQIAVMRQDMEHIAPLLGRLSVMEQSMRDLSTALNNAYSATPQSAHSAMPSQQNAQMPSYNNGAAPMATNSLPSSASLMPMNDQQNTHLAPANAAPKPYIPPVAKAQPKAVTIASVNNIRFGEYKGQDRVVLDLTAPANFRYDLDNNEKLLIIDLPSASWSTQMAKKITSSGAIAAYNAQPGANGGTQLIFSLKKNARVSQARALPPNGQYGHRIFIDIE
tara:strand:+ start:753932 stop:754918 length:987 start_codon:yes stop_codon:yes gene_type:complete